jgi:hypothetical protein
VDICLDEGVDASTVINTGVDIIIDNDDIGTKSFQDSSVNLTLDNVLKWTSIRGDVDARLRG